MGLVMLIKTHRETIPSIISLTVSVEIKHHAMEKKKPWTAKVSCIWYQQKHSGMGNSNLCCLYTRIMIMSHYKLKLDQQSK